MSTGLLASGVLSTEEGQRFLQIAEGLIDRGFWGLYHRFEDEEDLAGCRRYRSGLERVKKWGDDIIADDVKSTVRSNADFMDLLQRINRRFHEERNPGKECPQLKAEAWLRAFYLHAASSQRVRSGTYFRNSEDVVSRRIQAADSMRSAFFDQLITNEREVEISPDDSVSQVGESRGRAAREPAPVPEVALQPSHASRASVPPTTKPNPELPDLSRQQSIESIFQRHEV